MSALRSLVYQRNLISRLVHQRGLQTSAARLDGPEYWWGPEKAAGREVVGHGATGEPTYQDRVDYWYPTIRFRQDDDIIRPLREKEKSDWKKMSIEEKKLLYRYSFRQTLAEFEAPTGYWKVITAGALSIISLALLYSTFLNHYVYPPLPETFEDEYKEAMLERQLVLNKGSLLGVATEYDYEKGQWKE